MSRSQHRSLPRLATLTIVALVALAITPSQSQHTTNTHENPTLTNTPSQTPNAQRPTPPPFDSAVRPILEKRCLGCHGVGNRLAGLDLKSRESMLKGGSRGTAVVPGNSEKSLLYMLVNGNRAPLMPPLGKLPANEIATLKRWIDSGANWMGGELTSAKQQVWWSFRPPTVPPVPVLKSTWIRNPIDAFVLAKMQENGLTPSPIASRRIRIRRAYEDMIGLPPTPEEVAAFVNDPASDANAWEKVVDHLLASPHYGERWGRHWLDLARYADSGGFEGDKDRNLAWRYRDYVIDSFNTDKPYDIFLREQIAGDELSPDDPASIIATGYLACGPLDIVEVNARTRSNELDDLVSTTGSAILGLTLGCARCHDHKYDPVKMTDYYRLAAIFAPTERREMEAATPAERQAVAAHNAEVEKELAPLRQQAEPLKQQGAQAAIKAGQAKPTDDQILAALPADAHKRLTDLLAAIKATEAKRASLPLAMAVTDKGRDFPPSHLLLRGDAYHPGDEVKPGFICSLPAGATDIGPSPANANTTRRRTALAEWLTSPQNPLTARVWVNRVWRQHFGRGIVNTPSNFGLNGELPSHPELLDWLTTCFTGQQALGVGRWALGVAPAKSDSPLTNGTPSKCQSPIRPTPIRPTPNAQRPTPNTQRPAPNTQRPAPNTQRPTPNAQRPTPNAWTLKPLHRLILLSATYQQASDLRPEAAKIDPQGKWYWRMPVRRLEAEAIRDSLLSVAGTINLQMGGPPVYPPIDPSLRADTFQGPNWHDGEDSPSTWRRSVYVKVKRSTLLPQLEVFDCPEITYTVAQRNITTTPLQALMLLNDPLILRQAGLFAARLKRECGDDRSKQIDRAYRLAFGRDPSASEKTLSLNFLQKRDKATGLQDFCQAIFNLNEFVYVP